MNKAYNWGENMIVNVFVDFRVTLDLCVCLGGTPSPQCVTDSYRHLKHTRGNKDRCGRRSGTVAAVNSSRRLIFYYH